MMITRIFISLAFLCSAVFAQSQCDQYKSKIASLQSEIHDAKGAIYSSKNAAARAQEEGDQQEVEWAITKLRRAERHLQLALKVAPQSTPNCGCKNWNPEVISNQIRSDLNFANNISRSRVSSRSEVAHLNYSLQKLRSRIDQTQKLVNNICGEKISPPKPLLAQNKPSPRKPIEVKTPTVKKPKTPKPIEVTVPEPLKPDPIVKSEPDEKEPLAVIEPKKPSAVTEEKKDTKPNETPKKEEIAPTINNEKPASEPIEPKATPKPQTPSIKKPIPAVPTSPVISKPNRTKPAEPKKPADTTPTSPTPKPALKPVTPPSTVVSTPVRTPAQENSNYYSVQVGALSNDARTTRFSNFPYPIHVTQENGYYKHRVGKFDTKPEAQQMKAKVNAAGIPDAFVVKVGNPSSQETNTKPTITESPNTPTKKEAKPVVVPIENSEQKPNYDPYYSVQVLSSSTDKSQTQFKGLSYKVYTVKENGIFKHRIGKYETLSEALTVKNTVAKNGVSDAFVVAIYKGKRISISEAKKIQGTTSKTPPVNKAASPASTAGSNLATNLQMYLCAELKRLPNNSKVAVEIAMLENKIGLPVEKIIYGQEVILITNKTQDINQFESSFSNIQSNVPNAKKIGVASGRVVNYDDAKSHLSR